MKDKISLTKNRIFRFLSIAGIANFGIEFQKNRLQILTYHGLCAEEDIKHDWISSNFVTIREFDKQMSIVRKYMSPISLEEGVACLKNKRQLPPRSVAVTFDDGYRNNVILGGPVLKKYKIPATIFLSTEHINNQEFFHFDKYYILYYLVQDEFIDEKILQGPDLFNYKKKSVYKIKKGLESIWREAEVFVSNKMRSVLAPLSWDEITHCDELFSFGSHTRSHAILAHLNYTEKKEEIFQSIHEVASRLKVTSVPFSYPNGNEQDFDHEDIKLLQQANALCAATMINGSNGKGKNLFKLNRRGISRGFTVDAFMLELAGIRGLFSFISG